MDEARSEPICMAEEGVWYHGSPLPLETLRAGSTVTPIPELARAFAHKPSRVGISIREADGERTVTIEHNGRQEGFLYRVGVADPSADLRQHPTSRLAPGEEMLATRDLPLEPLGALPLDRDYGERLLPEGGTLVLRTAG